MALNQQGENGIEWRSIPEYEGLYEVSNQGQVKRLGGTPKCRKDRILKHHKRTSGYLFVSLCSLGMPTQIDIHRLVALVFLGKPNGLWVNHKNGNKLDNSLENLEYLTPSENNKHAYKLGLQPPRVGMGNGHAKATNETVSLIRELHQQGVSRKDIQNKVRLSKTAVRDIIVGFSWSHIP